MSGTYKKGNLALPTVGAMTENGTLTSYRTHADPLAAILEATTDWDAASPCEGWTARDVVAHIVETERDHFARHQVELGDPPDVGTDPAAGWRAHDQAVRRVLADHAVTGREFDGFFGPTTVGAMFLQVYGFDLIVHRWDIARSAGRDERFTDAELDTLEAAIAGFGEHLYADGICRPAIDVPAGADRQTRVLAALGRARQPA